MGSLLLMGCGGKGAGLIVDGILDGLGATSAHSASRYLLSAFSPTAKYTLDTGKVSIAADQTGNGRTVSQGNAANRPVIEAAGSLSRDSFSFDGSDDYLNGSTAISTLLSASTGYVICSFVLDAVSTNSGNIYDNDAIFSDTGNFMGFFCKNNTGTHTIAGYNWDGNADSPTAHSVSTGTAYVCEWRHEGGNLHTRLNKGSWNSTASGNTSTTTGGMVLGAEISGGGTNYTDMKIVDFATFSTVPDDATKDLIAQNFMDYIGAV